MPEQVETAKPLPAPLLRRVVSADTLPFKHTGELESYDALIGQDRAMDALRLASGIGHHDFNLFVLGDPGMGRHWAVRRLLDEQAATRDGPDDWVYVNNFDTPEKPRCLRLPPGTALRLKHAMQDVVDDLATDIPAFFESDEYQSQRRAIEEDYGAQQEQAMAEFTEKASSEDVALVRTPMGYMLAAMREGKVIKPDQYRVLKQEEKDAIDEKIARLQEELATVLRNGPKLERQSRKEVEELNARTAERVVSTRISELEAEFDGVDVVTAYLAEVGKDMVANASLFLGAAMRREEGPFPEVAGKQHENRLFDRYVVNVMVARDNGAGAPVVKEDLPTHDHLTGRVEHVSEMGALITNFTMIRPGALHRANGGYLILDARRLLAEPYAWDALKRCLKAREIAITSIAERLSLMSTVSLEPDPIPLDVRVILIGDRLLHALLVALDPDFGDLFKLQADFETTIEFTDDTATLFARVIASFAQREGLKPVAAPAVARLLEQALREAEDSRKLSLRIGILGDILREADHYAAENGGEAIEVADVDRAIHERDRRSARVKDRLQEAVARETILIDTAGQKTGQINGLSVIPMGDYRFGRASRITARVRMGAGKLVDIEREVELGGPLHSKGVMILSGYLTSTFALDLPFSLHASLVFEQSYGGVDGDSASSAELYAILSALADLPIDQGLAVTGSVNQLGEVQAIGGVNEKIEGFFDTCLQKGLTGTQGVLIPKANVEHLMLNRDVVEAVAAGRFRVIPVATIDEGIALLTGRPAGQRDADGAFPADSVNARVEARLRSFAEQRRAFGRDLNAGAKK
ncbi:Lon protease family protein [Marimonas lutisalis]|uniref:Lon protease family protein n=1 Tax=Marimonas lutisalis TaxID=2545756 RepID=UPI0010FA312F|nr:AAA family ATPase [Marimonas lutisalis]